MTRIPYILWYQIQVSGILFHTSVLRLPPEILIFSSTFAISFCFFHLEDSPRFVVILHSKSIFLGDWTLNLRSTIYCVQKGNIHIPETDLLYDQKLHTRISFSIAIATLGDKLAIQGHSLFVPLLSVHYIFIEYSVLIIQWMIGTMIIPIHIM